MTALHQLKEIRSDFIRELASIYSNREAEQLFMEAFFRIDKGERKDLIVKEQTSKLKRYQDCIAALKAGEPIQYHFGLAHFDGMEIEVNTHVLIPRPETEELVSWLAEELKDQELKIADLGTGSGCIALALAKRLPKAQIAACDVSANALKVAKQNAKNQAVAVDFYTCNLLDKNPEPADVYVSNPPYIPDSDRHTMHSRVLEHEPPLALFVPNEQPLIFYERIIQATKANACKSYVEIHEGLKSELEQLLINFGMNYKFKKDLQGKFRMLRFEGKGI